MRDGAGEASPASESLTVALGERSYEIVVGSGVLTSAGQRLRGLLPSGRVVVITDETVARLHLPALNASLEAAGVDHRSIILPPGEASKSFDHVEVVAERLLERGIDRATSIVALGGGVVGDIAGFVSGIVLRGIPYVQIPTTLLAQVDSSVGGKTGINTPQGKNLVGLFHQPRLVLADTATLDTLDLRQVRAGYAEVVKYGLIRDAAFFSWLEKNGTALLAGDPAARRQAIITSCRAKAEIVAQDEHEANVRALLNLGHTFGHALEVQTRYGDALLHGEAVAVGMVLAARLSQRRGHFPAVAVERVRTHLHAAGLPTRIHDISPSPWSAEILVEHMTRDKKVRNGLIVFVLLQDIGEAFVCSDVDPGDVLALLGEEIAE